MVGICLYPSTQKVEAGRSLEFEANLVYRVSPRIAKATQRNPVSKKRKRKRKEEKKKKKKKNQERKKKEKERKGQWQ